MKLIGSLIAGGRLWNIVAAALNQGSTFMANLWLANMLVSEQFGLYGAIQSSITAIAIASQLAAPVSAAYFCGRYRESDPRKLGRILYLIRTAVVVATAFVVLVLLVGRNIYADEVLASPGVGREIGLAAMFVFFSGLNSYQIGVVMGLDSLRDYARSSVVQCVIVVAFVVGLGYMAGAGGALAGLALGAASRCALTSRVVSRSLRRHGIHLHAAGAAGDAAEVFRFSLPTSLNAFTYMGALWVVATSVVRQPDGLLLSALYAVSMNIKTLVLFAPQQANAVSIVHLTRYRSTDALAYRTEFLLNMLMMFTVGLVSAGVVAMLAPQIMGLYGESFVEGVDLLRVLMVAAVAEAIGYGLTQHYSSRGAMWTVLFAAAVPRDLVVVSAAIWLLPIYGVTTIGWAYTVSWLIYSGMLLALSRRGP